MRRGSPFSGLWGAIFAVCARSLTNQLLLLLLLTINLLLLLLIIIVVVVIIIIIIIIIIIFTFVFSTKLSYCNHTVLDCLVLNANK